MPTYKIAIEHETVYPTLGLTVKPGDVVTLDEAVDFPGFVSADKADAVDSTKEAKATATKAAPISEGDAA